MSLQSRSAKWYLDPVAGNQLDIGRLGPDSGGVGGHVVNMCLGEVTAGRTPESGTCSGRDGFKTVNRRPGSDQLRAAVSGNAARWEVSAATADPCEVKGVITSSPWPCGTSSSGGVRQRASRRPFHLPSSPSSPLFSALCPCSAIPHRICASHSRTGNDVHSGSLKRRFSSSCVVLWRFLVPPSGPAQQRSTAWGRPSNTGSSTA